MTRPVCSTRSRLGALSIAVALVVLTGGPAKADTITTFDVSGTARILSGGSLDSCAVGAVCSFSGTLAVDVTSGTVTGVDITFPGLLVFDTLVGSFPLPPTANWEITAENSSGDVMDPGFTTSSTPASLVGFDGGTIVPRCACGVFSPSGAFIYGVYGGSVTPAAQVAR